MSVRQHDQPTVLTVDLLLNRLTELERNFAALQQAYVSLQASYGDPRGTRLADEMITVVPVVPAAGTARTAGQHEVESG